MNVTCKSMTSVMLDAMMHSRAALFVCVLACDSAGTGRTTIETDLPQAPPQAQGSASVARLAGKMHMVVSDVVATDACAALAALPAANAIVVTFDLDALDSEGNPVAGTYTSSNGSVVITDSTCATLSQVSASVTVTFDSSLRGFAKLVGSGSTTVVQFAASLCSPLDAPSTTCAKLAPCTDASSAPCRSAP